MKTVKVIFVSPKHEGLMKYVGPIVQGVCGSRWAHVGMFMFNGVVEAIMPEVTISPINKYEKDEVQEILEFQVSDRNYRAMEKKAKEIMGQDIKYGIRDCIAGGLSIVFGKCVGRFMRKLLRCGTTMDCSETITRILRAGKVAVFAEVPEDELDLITPQELYAEIKEIYCDSIKD